MPSHIYTYVSVDLAKHFKILYGTVAPEMKQSLQKLIPQKKYTKIHQQQGDSSEDAPNQATIPQINKYINTYICMSTYIYIYFDIKCSWYFERDSIDSSTFYAYELIYIAIPSYVHLQQVHFRPKCMAFTYKCEYIGRYCAISNIESARISGVITHNPRSLAAFPIILLDNRINVENMLTFKEYITNYEFIVIQKLH